MKTIIEMARAAGIRDVTCDGTRGCLERFAAFVRAEAQAEEREACAKVCEHEWSNAAEREFGDQCAAIIRGREARGDT